MISSSQPPMKDLFNQNQAMLCFSHFNHAITCTCQSLPDSTILCRRRWGKRSADVDGAKEATEVAVAGLVIKGVFDAVDKHATEACVVESTDAGGGGGGVFSGAEVVVEGVADGGKEDVAEAVDVHEV